MCKMKHLYVIGNGFDIHHGINSSYNNFNNWLSENDSSLLEDLENAYGQCDSEWWNDFENKLADMDTFTFAMDIANDNIPDITSDHYERTMSDAEIEVENQLSNLFQCLKEKFREWIQQLNAPQENKRLRIDVTDSSFFTFNYTKTLESFYHINSVNVLHIHGCDDAKSSNFILGHGASESDVSDLSDKYRKESLEGQNNNVDNKDNDEFDEDWDDNAQPGDEAYESWAIRAAIVGVVSQKKPVDDLIKKHANFFDRLNDIEDIHVYGYSFSSIDLPYLKKISDKCKGAKWEISDYQSSKKVEIEKFVKDNAIADYSIIDLDSILVHTN